MSDLAKDVTLWKHSSAETAKLWVKFHLYDVVANIFFFGHRRVTFQALIAAAGVQTGQRVLGVGCGTGYFTRLLAFSVGRDGLIVGIDPSPALITYASRQTG